MFLKAIVPSQKKKQLTLLTLLSCDVTANQSDSAFSFPPGDGSKTNSSPQFSQAKFDMSSFIGGIILVLCVQAGGFFAMRFLKSKEQSSYDPM